MPDPTGLWEGRMLIIWNRRFWKLRKFVHSYAAGNRHADAGASAIIQNQQFNTTHTTPNVPSREDRHILNRQVFWLRAWGRQYLPGLIGSRGVMNLPLCPARAG